MARPGNVVSWDNVAVHLLDTLREHRLLAVVPGEDPAAALASVLALAEAGLTLVAVPLRSREAVGVLARARAELGSAVPLGAGALTPGEVISASLAGAAAVMLYPASLGGPAYLRTLRDPFPGVPFVPCGGVDLESVSGYLAAGATAVGVGAELLADAPHGGDLAALRTRAAAFRAACLRALDGAVDGGV